MASCTVITAIICVLITTVAVIVAFATPNWVKFENLPVSGKSLCQCLNCDCGMWLHCVDTGSGDGSIDNCRWFFSEEFRIEKELPDWFKAVQGLMSCAVASSLLSLMIALFSLCCHCKSCNPHQAAGAFISLTFLLVAIAVSVFGAKGHLDYDIDVIADDNDLRTAIFGWSFWVAVGAGGMALVSSILYFCVGRNDEYI
ncbi:uncharacterized protein LOC106013624 [Aplysia californica]|uniref:Uncharacterized protein LOC101863199 n=1 Tax=Aplysia californica TaxID=6500 RepID=A0ABM1ACY4_APLCA|nr:uncharacterized protein LOC101863199 [Aplysia californica]XP_012945314.1 uncharacterized protein LOC106013624 [Aplysia californica]